jgi:hypothetical protein
MKRMYKSAFVVLPLYLVACGSATKPSDNVRFTKLLDIFLVDVSIAAQAKPITGPLEIGSSIEANVSVQAFEKDLNYTVIWTLVGADGSSVEFDRQSGSAVEFDRPGVPSPPGMTVWQRKVAAPAPPGTYKVVCRLEQSKAGQQSTSSVSAEFQTMQSK